MYSMTDVFYWIILGNWVLIVCETGEVSINLVGRYGNWGTRESHNSYITEVSFKFQVHAPLTIA